MSERTYAPRSGGRAAEPRAGDTRRSGTRREQGADAEAVRRDDRARRADDRVAAAEQRRQSRGRTADGTGTAGRGADRASRAGTPSRGAGRGREQGESRIYREAGLGRGARTDRDAARAEREAGLDRASRTVRAERVNRAGRVERPGRLDRSVRAEAAGSRAALRTRRPETAGRRGGLTAGLDAPVDGTAALRVDAEPLRADAEPARVIDLDRPRLQVAPPAPISVPRAPFVAGVLGLVVAGVIGILLINTKTNENSFKIADLQKQSSALDAQQQDLDNQLAIVSSPGSLDAAARRLGLVKAQPAVIRLPDGKVIGMLRPADGKPAVTAQDAASTDDKGAANIVPDGAATTPAGLTPNGTGATAPNGATGAATGANGPVANGPVANGQTGNGQVTTGQATNGQTGGQVANGQTGGQVANGQTGTGQTGTGVGSTTGAGR